MLQVTVCAEIQGKVPSKTQDFLYNGLGIWTGYESVHSLNVLISNSIRAVELQTLGAQNEIQGQTRSQNVVTYSFSARAP